jgi:hypothetical protein
VLYVVLKVEAEMTIWCSRITFLELAIQRQSDILVRETQTRRTPEDAYSIVLEKLFAPLPLLTFFFVRVLASP